MKLKYCIIIILLITACNSSKDRIVFSSSRNGNSDIYIMNADGSSQKALTKDSTEEWAPTIKRNGNITFLRQTENTIVRVSLDPYTGKESYIPHPQNCMLDDKNIIYNTINDDQLYACDGNVFIADSIGAIKINLTDSLGGVAYKPVWYPNADKIVFSYNNKKQSDIYAVNIDGSGLINLTQSKYNEEAPDVSPDGKRILFTSDKDGNNNQEIYVMDLASRSLENITNSPDWELIARWSRDGESIYYGSNKDGNWELYSYDLQSKATKRLTTNEVFDGDPRVTY